MMTLGFTISEFLDGQNWVQCTRYSVCVQYRWGIISKFCFEANVKIHEYVYNIDARSRMQVRMGQLWNYEHVSELVVSEE